MYAIIAAGGKQYKVEVGQVLRLEKISAAVGDKINLQPVLLVAAEEQEAKIGRPFLEEAQVAGMVMEQGKARKILIMKKKRRKGYRVKRGHRQPYTLVRIVAIEA